MSRTPSPLCLFADAPFSAACSVLLRACPVADYQAATHDVINGSLLYLKSWDDLIDAYVYGSWNDAASQIAQTYLL